jgi:hypothetical protein
MYEKRNLFSSLCGKNLVKTYFLTSTRAFFYISKIRLYLAYDVILLLGSVLVRYSLPICVNLCHSGREGICQLTMYLWCCTSKAREGKRHCRVASTAEGSESSDGLHAITTG